MFCAGRHPLYPGVRMDGTCTLRDALVLLRARVRGCTPHPLLPTYLDGVSCSLAPHHPTLTPPTPHSTTSGGSVDRRIVLPRDSGRFFRADGLIQLSTVNKDNLVDFATGWRQIYAELKRKVQGVEGRTMVIRDYYPYWHQKDRQAHASKAMPIDAADMSVHQIFFDDNIADTHAKIVDVYDVGTGRREGSATVVQASAFLIRQPVLLSCRVHRHTCTVRSVTWCVYRACTPAGEPAG